MMLGLNLLGLSVLLAVGLLALLVIWVVARNLDDFRLSTWFKLSPDRGTWWLIDHELTSMPELAGIDRRERRVLYIEASKSVDRSGWIGGASMGTGWILLQPLAPRVGEMAIAAFAHQPVLDRLPPYLIGLVASSLLYSIPTFGYFRWRRHAIERVIRRELNPARFSTPGNSLA